MTCAGKRHMYSTMVEERKTGLVEARYLISNLFQGTIFHVCIYYDKMTNKPAELFFQHLDRMNHMRIG